MKVSKHPMEGRIQPTENQWTKIFQEEGFAPSGWDTMLDILEQNIFCSRRTLQCRMKKLVAKGVVETGTFIDRRTGRLNTFYRVKQNEKPTKRN